MIHSLIAPSFQVVFLLVGHVKAHGLVLHSPRPPCYSIHASNLPPCWYRLDWVRSGLLAVSGFLDWHRYGEIPSRISLHRGLPAHLVTLNRQHRDITRPRHRARRAVTYIPLTGIDARLLFVVNPEELDNIHDTSKSYMCPRYPQPLQLNRLHPFPRHILRTPLQCQVQ
jgi:hypothetical protein